MKIEEVENLEIDGVDTGDYPDFCDAHFIGAWHIKEQRECTEEELEKLTEDYPDVINEMAFEHYI